MTATLNAHGHGLFAQIGDVVHDLPAFLTAPLYRRWHLRWGASPNEIAGALPGDAFLPHAQYRSTRAITIDAPPESVWPWLVQVGCGRAGFYSNDLLDNLGHPSARTIVPDLQHLEVGQWVPMSPSSTPTDATAFTVHSFEVNRWLLWSKPDSTWAWQLTRTDSGGTRLVTRIHAARDWRHPLTAILSLVLMEFGDFAMLRRMLRGIKERAESLAKEKLASGQVSSMGTALHTSWLLWHLGHRRIENRGGSPPKMYAFHLLLPHEGRGRSRASGRA